METGADQVAASSIYFKALLTFFCSLLVPLSAICFVSIRRTRKQEEFRRVVDVLGIASEEAEFARDRVTEQYAARDYYAPVALVWLLAILGFYALFYGADMVSEHKDKPNFVLTGVLLLGSDDMHELRVRHMVILVWAFLGAFMWACLHISRRINSGDLAPSAYVSTAIRFILAPTLSLAIAFVFKATPEMFAGGAAALPAFAFLVGFFPDEALVYLRQRVPIFADSGKHAAHRLPLGMIEGITVFDRARLDELEINDAQNLATADLVEILVRTPFTPSKVIDWIGQAQLFLYFKDDVAALRKCQVRSIFDLIALDADGDDLPRLAEQTGISAFGLKLAAEQAGRDPKIVQLRRFRDRLCYAPAGEEATPALPPPEPERRLARVVDGLHG